MIKKILLTILLFSLTGCSNTVDLSAASDVSATALSNKYNQASGVKSKYQLIGTALKTIPKADPKDRIVVTVGNDEVLLGAEGEFAPSVKISRWDEVSLKMTPKGLDKIASKDKKLSFEGNKIKFETPKQNFELYDLPASEDLPEGGYEFEIILKERPLTNKIEFSLNTKGLDFFYQPPLTEEYKDGYNEEFQKDIVVSDTDVKDKDGNGLVHRPENVVGAYAVYASENKINWVGGKEYKTGQVGMIYRPKIVDSVGNGVWGELNVDTEKGILSVTIPNDFLDNAVYPVRHAAGLTFGYDTAGSSFYSYGSNYAIMANGTPAGGDGTVSKISVSAKEFTNRQNAKGVIWLAADGTVITNGVAGTVYVNKTTKQWWDMTYGTSPSVTNGTGYFVGLTMDGSGCNWAFNTGAAGTGGYDTTNSYATPQTFGVAGSTTRNSIYATYSSGEPPASTPSPAQQIIIFD